MKKRLLLTVLAFCVLVSGGARAGTVSVQNVKTDHAAVGDARKIEGVQTAFGTGNIATQVDVFVEADVGKWGWCNNVGAGEVNPNIEWSQITAFTDARHVTFGDGSNNTTGGAICVFGTQDDTSAFVSAYNAAILASAGSVYPDGGPGAPGHFKAGVGTIYAPAGGYIVGSRIYNKQDAGLAPAPSFAGEGRYSTLLFTRPDFVIPGDGTGVLVQATGAGGQFRDFGVDCAGMRYMTWGSEQDFMRFISFSQSKLSNIAVRFCGQGVSTNGAIIGTHSSSDFTWENVWVKDGPGLNLAISCKFNQVGAATITESWCSNASQSVVVINSKAKTPLTKSLLFVGGGSDECGGNGTRGCLNLTNSDVMAIGTTHWGGNAVNGAVTVDGTSRLTLIGAAVGSYNSGSEAIGMHILAGGVVYAQYTTIWGTTAPYRAVNNQGTFWDMGGNAFQNCVGATCANKTGSQAFVGKLPRVR